MLIILKKKVDSNQWNYPANHKLFTEQFINSENSGELIAFNNSGKTLVELSALAGYQILEYFGELQGTGIREISPYAFRRRFTKLERKSIRKSQVDDVQDVNESLEYAKTVRLDHPYLISDMDILVSNGIIDSARKSELLADGVEEETI